MIAYNHVLMTISKKPMTRIAIYCFSLYVLLSILVSGCKELKGKPDMTDFDAIEIKGTDIKTIFKYDSLGNKIIEGNVIGGKKNGVWINYMPGGQIQTIINYVDDKKNGPYIKMSNDNRIAEQGSYVDDLLHGAFTRYLYGRLDEQFEFKHGLKHGILKKYYHGGGVQREIEYKDDIREGIFRFYSENGTLQVEEKYRQGKKISGGIVNK